MLTHSLSFFVIIIYICSPICMHFHFLEQNHMQYYKKTELEPMHQPGAKN